MRRQRRGEIGLKASENGRVYFKRTIKATTGCVCVGGGVGGRSYLRQREELV